MTKSAEIGRIGEELASKYLIGKNYSIVARNYRNGYGEIDIVCMDGEVLVFVEVKTVSREMSSYSISRETSGHRPEDNVHSTKLRKIYDTAERYVMEKSLDADWRVDVVAIELYIHTKKAKIRHIKSV